jgi:hypothetical protein
MLDMSDDKRGVHHVVAGPRHLCDHVSEAYLKHATHANSNSYLKHANSKKEFENPLEARGLAPEENAFNE